MTCADCGRTLEVGDRYIRDSASGFVGKDSDPEIDGLVAESMGGQAGEVFFCEDCTVPGGDYLFETVWGDDDG